MSSAHRALVTGGAGFVGSHLCDSLVSAGWEVVCLDNLSTGLTANIDHLRDRPGFSFVEHDVTLPLPALGGFRWVFALASAASPLHYHRLAIETLRAGARGTEHALDVARDHGSRFILASTSEVYGDPDENPQTESYWGRVNPVGPRSVYDEAKRFAEALTAAYRRSLGVDTGIARIFNTYGPRMRDDDGRMVPTFVRQALAGDPITITGTGRQTRSLCYVTDTVAGLLALAASDEAGPINLGNPVEQTVNQLAEQIRSLSGSTSPLAATPAVVDDPQQRCPDIRLAIARLGWRPRVSLPEGLRRTIEDVRAGGTRSESPLGVLAL